MPGAVVPDSSVVAKWVIREHDSTAARNLRTRWLREGRRLAAPPHLLAEVAGVIRRHQRMGEFDLAGAATAMRAVLIVGIDVVTDRSIYLRALELADRFERSIPDTLYLAVAERLGCDFWTADEALVNAVGGRLGWVRLLR